MRTIVIALFILTSCSSVQQADNKPEFPSNYVDSTFNPIIDSFIYEARLHNTEVDLSHGSIVFANIRVNKKDTTLGYCRWDDKGNWIIRIHEPSWSKLGEYRQEVLVFHELAHCALDRRHCGKTKAEKPISIMFPKVLSESYYKDNREELVDELFNVSPECIGDNGDINEIDGPVCSPSHHNSRR